MSLVQQMQVCTVQNATAVMKTSFVVENAMNAIRMQETTARNAAVIMTGAKPAEKEPIVWNVRRNSFANSVTDVHGVTELNFVMNADFVQNAALRMHRVKTAAAGNTASTAEAGRIISVKTAEAASMNTSSANTADTVPTVVKAKLNAPAVCV